MLTGDNTPTARAIAAQVGIDEARGDQLPEDKLAAIESKLSPAGKVGMVGDGINDAPALARADIGFAMGAAGTGTAIETADVALMDDDLRKIGVFLRLSRATHSVLVQNIALALGIKAVFLVLAMTGNATLWMAVFADVGASLLVVANGLRLLRAAPRARGLGRVAPSGPGSALGGFDLHPPAGPSGAALNLTGRNCPMTPKLLRACAVSSVQVYCAGWPRRHRPGPAAAPTGPPGTVPALRRCPGRRARPAPVPGPPFRQSGP